MPKCLNIDPGFSWLGWSVCDLTKTNERVIKLGLIRTEKSDKKTNVRAADDNFRRAQYIHNRLWGCIDIHRPSVICFEAYSPVRNSGVAAKLGHAYGVIAAIASEHHIPVVAISPQGIKKAMCGKANASKEEVTKACIDRYWRKNHKVMQSFMDEFERNKANHNHAWDSLGAMVATLDSEVVKAFRR